MENGKKEEQRNIGTVIFFYFGFLNPLQRDFSTNTKAVEGEKVILNPSTETAMASQQEGLERTPPIN